MANYNGKQSFTVPRQIVLKNGVNVEAGTDEGIHR